MKLNGGDRGMRVAGVEGQNEGKIIGRCFTYEHTTHTQQMVIEIGWIARFPKVDICILNNDYFIHADCASVEQEMLKEIDLQYNSSTVFFYFSVTLFCSRLAYDFFVLPSKR